MADPNFEAYGPKTNSEYNALVIPSPATCFYSKARPLRQEDRFFVPATIAAHHQLHDFTMVDGRVRSD